VLAGNQLPDHVTVARFRVRHQQALAGFLVESLRLCAAAGMVRLGVVALDGTKVAANAADRANRTLAKLEEEVAEILRQAAEADQAEDHQHGGRRGDELPAELASPTSRLARLQQAKALVEADAAQRQRRYLPAGDRGGRAHPAHQRPATAATDAGRHHRDPDGRGDPGAAWVLLADCGYWSIANLTRSRDAPELLIPPARHGRQGKPRKDAKPSASPPTPHPPPGGTPAPARPWPAPRPPGPGGPAPPTNMFWSLAQARVVISDWKEDDNHRRRHSALGSQAPAVCAPACNHQ
jgi:hypothetical protein